MIQTISVKCSAHDASISLDSIYSYENSLISLRVIDVPKRIGTWDITNVYFSFQNGNEIVTKEAVKTNGVYVVTVNEDVEPMTSWYRLSAKGIDENGEVVEAYNLGQGDITILDTDGTIHIDGTEYYVHLIDELTDAPKKGDLYHDETNFAWKIFDGEEWKWLGEKPLPIATTDTVGVLKATENYITLSSDGTITGLSSDYTRKVDDNTEGLENYAKKSDLKKSVFSCTCINNSSAWKTHTISFYKFVVIEGDKVKYQLAYKDIVIKANSSVRYYIEIPEETQGISTNTGYTLNVTYCDKSNHTQTAYEVNDINIETHPNIDFSKDIVATWEFGTITTPIATTDTVGGIRATETYISLNDDGDIISLKANHSDSAYEAQVADEAKYARKVDDNTVGLSAYVKKSELDVGVTKITAGNNIAISPNTGVGNVTISAVIPSLSVATNTTLGGLKATSKYITLSSDGTITRLDCDTAMIADTANFATNADEASHALTADNALTADHAYSSDTAMTADYALTADHAYSSDTALTADNALTAYNAMTADYAYIADTANYAENAQNASWSQWSQGCDMANDVLESSTTLQNYVLKTDYNSDISAINAKLKKYASLSGEYEDGSTFSLSVVIA